MSSFCNRSPEVVDRTARIYRAYFAGPPLVRLISIAPASAVLFGAIVGSVVETAIAPQALALLLLIFAVLAWIGWCGHRDRAALTVTVIAFICAAAALASDARHRALRPTFDPPTSQFTQPTGVRVRLLEDASPQAAFTMLSAEVIAFREGQSWRSARAGVTMTVGGLAAPGLAESWRAGRVLETFATFRRPAQYWNDGVPDFERDLALSGITFFGSIKSGWLIEVHAAGNRVQEAAASVRAHVRRSVARWVGHHDAVSAAIVTAVLIGDRTGLPEDVRLRLQSAGTYHVIAISGGNIAILAGLIFGLLRLCGLSSRPSAFVTLVVLVGYAQVVSAGASVWRATLMAVLYLGARLLDHRSPPWHALGAAAAAMICVRPLDVRDAGFILTFGATAALLHAARRLTPSRTDRMASSAHGNVAGWLITSVAASMAVEVALLPVNAWTFSRVTSAGLVLNLAAVPLMAAVQIGGIVVSCLPSVDLIAGPAGWIAYAASAALVGSSRLVELAPWLTARVPPPPLALVAMYYGGLLILLVGRGVRRLCGAAILVVATMAIVSGQPAGWLSDAAPSGRLRLTMFDVGQGDSVLLQFPDRSRLLVDTGGIPFGNSTFDIGSRVLAPALWARGIRRLDALLVTHGDPDHIGGATAVIEDFAPNEVWEGVPVERSRPLQELLAQAVSAGMAIERRRAGESWPVGGARVRVLHPPLPDWERQRVRNDDSVVLEVLYGDVAILMLGDVGADVERSILPQLTPVRHRILKVGHHGSRTSTSQALLDAWRPQIALISCGRDNTFGHPVPEVIRRLESIGARIYRTDLDGQITIDTDGSVVTVRAFAEKNK